MIASGFHHRQTSGLDMFLEQPDASARDAIHIVLVGKVEREGTSRIQISTFGKSHRFSDGRVRNFSTKETECVPTKRSGPSARHDLAWDD